MPAPMSRMSLPRTWGGLGGLDQEPRPFDGTRRVPSEKTKYERDQVTQYIWIFSQIAHLG